jgi:hypothetical protein
MEQRMMAPIHFISDWWSIDVPSIEIIHKTSQYTTEHVHHEERLQYGHLIKT